MFTFQILANNHFRFKHSVGVRPKPPKPSDFSTLKFSDTGLLISSASGGQGALAPSAAPLTTLENIATPQKSNTRSWGKPTKPKAFTSFARDSVQEACCTLDRIYSRNQLRFITLTLPGSRFDSLDLLSRWSGWFADRLLKVLRNWKKYNPEAHSVFVWELQDRGALHIHWVIGCQENVDVLANRVKDKWYDLLLELGDKENVDMFARRGFGGSHRDNPDSWQYKIEEIKKSVASYMSKYCTKSFNKFNKKLARFCPSRWWSCSNNLRAEIDKRRLKLSFSRISPPELDDFLLILYSLFPSDSVSLQYFRPWALPDLGISGITQGVFFDADCFDSVIESIMDFVWRFYNKISQDSRDFFASVASGYSSNVLPSQELLRIADKECLNIAYSQKKSYY